MCSSSTVVGRRDTREIFETCHSWRSKFVKKQCAACDPLCSLEPSGSHAIRRIISCTCGDRFPLGSLAHTRTREYFSGFFRRFTFRMAWKYLDPDLADHGNGTLTTIFSSSPPLG